MRAIVFRSTRGDGWVWGLLDGRGHARGASTWRDAFDDAFAEVTRRRGLTSEQPC